MKLNHLLIQVLNLIILSRVKYNLQNIIMYISILLIRIIVLFRIHDASYYKTVNVYYIYV